MTWAMRGALGALLVAGLSCGPSEAEAMKLKEGSNLEDVYQCPGIACFNEDEFCAEVLLEYGRSPPLCVTLDICERMECLESGRRCVFFDGFPIQVRCIEDN